MAPDERDDPAAVVVTGMGVHAPIGADCGAFWASIEAGRHGIRAVTRFDTEGYTVRLAATLADPAWDARYGALGDAEGEDPCARVALRAASEAHRDAGVGDARVDPRRVALILGSTSGGLYSRSSYEFCPAGERARRHALMVRSRFMRQTAAVADALGIRGPRLTVSTACTSSTNAVAHALELLRAGRVDVALAGGVDVLFAETFAGFHALGSMSPAPCAPFSEPVGMTVGEGAGFVVLERLAHARARGRAPRCVVRGAGASLDGYHATAPDPAGAGVVRAIAAALRDAGVAPADVGYVNAHGTGTEANDAAECRALGKVFGPGLARIPVSSTKSFVGHALGAAGALEFITTALALERQVVPPTLGFTRARGGGPPDPVAGTTVRAHAYACAVSTNSAFGGANAALVLCTPARDREAPRAPRDDAPDDVVVVGVATLGPHGTGDLDAALRGDAPLLTPVDPAQSALPLPAFVGATPDFALESLVRGADPRGVDVLGRRLAAAGSLALADAGVRLRGPLRERAGLFLAAGGISHDTCDEFWGSIRARGFPRVSAPAFSRLVLNAPAGVVSRALGVHGPVTVLAGGPGSALAALVLATDALGRRTDADVLLVASNTDLGLARLEDHAFEFPATVAGAPRADAYPADGERPMPGEATCCVVLARRSAARALGLTARARVAGCGLAGVDGLADAIAAALAPAGCGPGDLDAVYGSAGGTVDDGRRELDGLREALGPRLDLLPVCNAAPVVGSSDLPDGVALVAALGALRVGAVQPRIVARGPGARPERPVRVALVVSVNASAGSFAVVLRAPELRPDGNPG